MPSIILAIDDDPIILDVYQSILGSQHSLHLVSSGEAALEFLRSGPRPDLILLDIMMPGMNGYDVCQNIRAHSFFSHLKIILVSAKITVEERLLGYDVGADDYITKPFEESEILAKVNSFLRLKNVEEIHKIKKDLFVLVSHEMRTPLNGIIGFTQLLKESENLTDEEKEYVGLIHKCGQDLLALSDKTVLLNDLRSGNIDVKKMKLKPNELISRCQLNLSDNIGKKHLSFQIRGDTDAEVIGDSGLLLHAFQLVIENAVHYAFEGTLIEVTLNQAENQTQIDIANEGEKIADDYLEGIFDVFFVQNIEQHHRGHGLSLATARRVVEAHDGTLSAKNHDKGPVFSFKMKT